jgi:hypothetical protein
MLLPNHTPGVTLVKNMPPLSAVLVDLSNQKKDSSKKPCKHRAENDWCNKKKKNAPN